MAGKDKIERGIRILFDDTGGTQRDMSSDLVPGSLNGGGKTLEQVDMTGVSNEIKQALGGFADAPVSARFHMNDTASTGAFTVLKGMVGLVGTLTIRFGSNGNAPVTGDWEWEGEYLLLSAPVVGDGGRLLLDAQFIPGSTTAPAWAQYST